MPAFITRVELHQATGEDYEDLHEAMENAGFARLILASNGNLYHLPTAEYQISGDFTIRDIVAAAQAATKLTGKENAVFVSEYVRVQWVGLPVV